MVGSDLVILDVQIGCTDLGRTLAAQAALASRSNISLPTDYSSTPRGSLSLVSCKMSLNEEFVSHTR